MAIFFVRPQTSSCMEHFLADFNRFTVNPAVTGSSPCFSQKRFRAFEKHLKRTRLKGPLFNFFWHCEFRFFFRLQRVPPSSFFLIFCSKLKCQKAQRVSSFKDSGTMRLFRILFFESKKKLENF